MLRQRTWPGRQKLCKKRYSGKTSPKRWYLHWGPKNGKEKVRQRGWSWRGEGMCKGPVLGKNLTLLKTPEGQDCWCIVSKETRGMMQNWGVSWVRSHKASYTKRRSLGLILMAMSIYQEILSWSLKSVQGFFHFLVSRKIFNKQILNIYRCVHGPATMLQKTVQRC